MNLLKLQVSQLKVKRFFYWGNLEGHAFPLSKALMVAETLIA